VEAPKHFETEIECKNLFAGTTPIVRRDRFQTRHPTHS
jgi:hypothetical protein